MKDIKGYEGLYAITKDGRVWRYKRRLELPCGIIRTYSAKFIKMSLRDKKSYLAVHLRDDKTAKTFAVHRLVAQTFIPNPRDKPEVNHRDGNKTNNNVDNLEWATGEENSEHARDIGLIKRGEKHHNCRLTNADVLRIRQYRKSGFTGRKIASLFSISITHVYDICAFRKWKHL